MTPLDAWVATTSSAAALCGVDDRLGTISPAKLADLTVIEGDIATSTSSASGYGECGKKAPGCFSPRPAGTASPSPTIRPMPPAMTSLAVKRRASSGNMATVPVQPVWWLAPMPAPLSPWKYS